MAYLDELNQIWQMVRDDLRSELTSTITDLFLGGLVVTELEDTVIVMSADSAIKARTVNAKYKGLIEQRLSELLGYEVTIRLECPPAEQNSPYARAFRGGISGGTHGNMPGSAPGGTPAGTPNSTPDGVSAGTPHASQTAGSSFSAPSQASGLDASPASQRKTPVTAGTVSPAKSSGYVPSYAQGASSSQESLSQRGEESKGISTAGSASGSTGTSAEGTSTAGATIGSTMPPFNFEYTFENFIVGSSNKFAHAACLAVATNPAQAGNVDVSDKPLFTYNPLFIYGPSGLGKTHLLYAITNRLKQRNDQVKVIYIKGEDFTNQLVDSLSRHAIREFRDKYRSCDVLLIDDIQFIAGKNSTQEEFFHTFNALYEDNKQIILTSDRPPREIKTLEDRLKTRFEWGLIADIQPPDMELRTAIIKKKADQVNVSLPDDVLTFLAENLRSNIRQIEGAIKKLGAQSFVLGNSITMEVARGCISELLGGEEPTTVTVDKIFSAVYRKYNIRREDIVSARRTKSIATARHISIYLLRTVTDMSLPNIGKIFERDHSTVISSIDTVERRMASDAVFKAEMQELAKEIKGL